MTSLITKTGSAAVLALLLCGAAQAQQAPAASSDSDVRFFGLVNMTFGGDKLATAEYNNGESETMKAGVFAQFGLGVETKISSEWFLQASASYHTDSVEVVGAKASFTRIPFEVLALYEVNPSFRLGAGLRYASGPVYKETGWSDVPFKNAISPVIEGEFFFNDNKKFGVTVRYVKETYTSKGFNEKVDGSHVGIGLKAYF